MPERRLLHFDIADRQRELRDLVAPDDFVLLRRDTPCVFPARALAYCADMQAERVLFSLHGADMAALFDAPFLYAAQLRDARQVVTVPFEQLAALDAGTACRPSLIFSPGRAGSTLLARLLAACGMACASEPDMLTQVCRFEREERARIGPDMEVALLRTCLAALARALGPAPFVKLRSHCNARPLPLCAAAGDGRAFLLWRRVAPWALSRHRTFGESPASVAAVLRQAVDAADKLLGEPSPPTILWFEDLLHDPAAVLQACVPDLALDLDRVGRVMATDSQAGTAIARDALAGATEDADFADAFAASWAAARAGAEWAAATQALLNASAA
jgi:hypothetical protein